MPLYDVTHKDRKIKPETAGGKYVEFIKGKLNASQWKMINRIFDEALDDLVNVLDGDNKLIWTKTAAMFGRSSKRPLHDVERLWARVIECVGPDKECLIAMGSLLRFKIANRDETWLGYKQETDSTDPETGKKISTMQYWVDDDYNMFKEPEITLQDLASKFNRRRL